MEGMFIRVVVQDKDGRSCGQIYPLLEGLPIPWSSIERDVMRSIGQLTDQGSREPSTGEGEA